MKTLETERLLLRGFTEADFDSLYSYTSNIENTAYNKWGPYSVEDSKAFINMAIAKAYENPCTLYQYAIVLKDVGKIIGDCHLEMAGEQAKLGWIIHRDYWKQGFGTEVGRALLEIGFVDLNLHRITASCDSENIGSYRIMEKIGMRREGVFLEGRPAHKQSDKKHGDELSYAVLKDEWETQNEMAYYNSMPCIFNNFIELPELSDDIIHLVCIEKVPENPEKKWVPGYNFAVCKGSERIGEINFRIGYCDSLYFGGQIGYGIDEEHRGNGYAGRACRLLLPVAKAHGMKKLLITNDHTNTASRRVCEKLGARHIRTARLPEWHDLYKEGRRFSNIFEWSVE